MVEPPGESVGGIAANLRSQAVMRRIGMTRDPADDFDDPAAPEGSLRPSVLYRIARSTGRRRPTLSHQPLTDPVAAETQEPEKALTRTAPRAQDAWTEATIRALP